MKTYNQLVPSAQRKQNHLALTLRFEGFLWEKMGEREETQSEQEQIECEREESSHEQE